MTLLVWFSCKSLFSPMNAFTLTTYCMFVPTDKALYLGSVFYFIHIFLASTMQYSEGIKMPSINQAVCFNCSSVEKCPYCVSCFFTLIPGSVVQLCMFIAFGYGIISRSCMHLSTRAILWKIVCAFFTSSIISSMSYFTRSVSSKKSWGLIE